ncbi:hypothetical protein [Lentzea cavernae]|uniref:Uncharacterized protein n=1 Tax=Lentzea cavernae TaxID=2020703 RepID=A0ABQ3MIL1_9PSEU|nr:hypothetical protein [Lentzea cavernae]GHH48219.1 hypothetical protein GCM10017774_53810 [Lentzea cavernae]
MIKPDVPQMDPLRLQVRKHALLNEISSKPSRRWWRFAVPATALVAAVAVTMVLWTPTNPNASASWTAEPRAPGADTEAAVAECREMIEEGDRREKPPNFPEAPTEVSVVDQRGIMTLALFTGPQSELICRHVQGGYTSLTGSGRAEGLEQLGDELFRSFGASMHSERNGRNPTRIFSGMVSPKVGKALIQTEDGLRVTATIGEGWLLAWWPSKEDATLITLYDHQGNELGTRPAIVR